MNQFLVKNKVLVAVCLGYAGGQLLAEASSIWAAIWNFLSPLQWLASLALVMVGDLPTIQGIMRFLTQEGAGFMGGLLRVIEVGILGAMLVLATDVVYKAAREASRLGSSLFRMTFTPIWIVLITYKPFYESWSVYVKAAEPFEQLPGELRRGVGFGVLLLAIVIPLLVMLSTMAIETILNPERAYAKR